ESVCSGKRNSILKAGSRNVGIKDSKLLNDFGIRIRKNRKSNSKAASEVFDGFGTIVCNDSNAETELLIFRERLHQLDQLGFAPGSPIHRAIEKQNQAFRTLERIEVLHCVRLIDGAERRNLLADFRTSLQICVGIELRRL